MDELFEHTADVGLRVRADDLGTLFAEAGRALLEALVDAPDAVMPAEEASFSLEAERLDDLLHDWLAELLYAFHARRMVFAQFDVEIDPPRLRARARGEHLDPRRHRVGGEIKAVTYHGLCLQREDGGWLAEAILDL